MTVSNAGKKLHSLSKSERLCNFTYKKLLFDQGESFHLFPFRVFWKLLQESPEEVLFSHQQTEFMGRLTAQTKLQQTQNPSYPYKKVPENGLFKQPVKLLVGASSKVHRRAVMRNRLKRLIREAYRQNKQPLYSLLNNASNYLLLGFIYTAPQVVSSSEIEKKIIVSLQKLSQIIQPEITK